jgi:selenocysteine-specific translation elongation factor
MNENDRNKILMEVAPYVSDIEFLKRIMDESKDIEDLKNKLNKLLEKEEDITRKTDIRIVLNEI